MLACTLVPLVRGTNIGKVLSIFPHHGPVNVRLHGEGVMCFINQSEKQFCLVSLVVSLGYPWRRQIFFSQWLKVMYCCGNLPQRWNSPRSWPLSKLALHQHNFSESFRRVKAYWRIVLPQLSWWRCGRWCGGGRSFAWGREELWIFFRDLKEIPFGFWVLILQHFIEQWLLQLNIFTKMFRPNFLFRFF